MGFKGVGKTTFGKKLAKLLKWEFLDTDSLIINLYVDLGHDYKSVYEIHKKIGEENFRKLEAQAIKSISLNQKHVVALGGGTILNSESVALLKKLGPFVYLANNKEMIMKNIKIGKIPSFLKSDDFEKSFDAMYKKRLSIYESLANYTLNIADLKETEILAKLYEIAFKP